MIFPMFAISWSFIWIVFIQFAKRLDRGLNSSGLETLAKWIVKIIMFKYIALEVTETIKGALNIRIGDHDVYALLHGRSEELLKYDYQRLIKENPNDKITPLKEVESIYFTNKYDSPGHMISHTN